LNTKIEEELLLRVALAQVRRVADR
jgi:hypothetical protein